MRRALYVAFGLVLLLACMLSCTRLNHKDKPNDPIICTKPALATDSLPSLPGVSVFTGVCEDSAGDSFRYTIAGKWNEEIKNAEEYAAVTVGESRFTGVAKSACPSNPWTHRVACAAVSMKGEAFRYYRTDHVPLTGGTGR